MLNEPLKINYHSHTKRCGHAEGEDEEYVLSAIENGYRIYGFSDHIMLPGFPQLGMRGNYELQAQNYYDSVKQLKVKYRKQIELHLGWEAEWYGDLFADYYHDLLAKNTVEYMILGQHCFLDRGHFVFYGNMFDKQEAVRKYASDLIAGMRSGNFIYVAHPDTYMIWYGKWDDVAKEVARDIINAAKETGTILEINMGPSRWGKKTDEYDFRVAYPNEEFWDLVSEAGIPCIIGVDNHRPCELKQSPYDWVRRFAKRHGLTPLDHLELPFKVR